MADCLTRTTESPDLNGHGSRRQFTSGLRTAWSFGSDDVKRAHFSAHSEKAGEGESGSSSKHILLVEDNPGDAGLVREALEQHGVVYQMTHIRDGGGAIRWVEEVDEGSAPSPDLIILDLNLPRRTGFEVLQRIRLSQKCDQVPVVVLTTSDLQKDKEEAASLGASRYLRKPSQLDDFLQLGAVFKQMLESGPG